MCLGDYEARAFSFLATDAVQTFPSEEIEKDELELQLARTRVPTLSF